MVSKYIKNTTNGDKTYRGQTIGAGGYYLIQSQEESAWISDSSLLTDIGNSDALVAKTDDGSNDITDVNTAINYLKNLPGLSDSDGVPLLRNKITKAGWHFQMYSLDFTTAKLNSLVDLDETGAAAGLSTIKFYNSSDVELVAGTQTELDSSCVKTVVDWEPTWDYEIIGGQFRQHSVPGSDIRMHTVAVPDIPAVQGGSIPYINNLNLKYIGASGSINTDGRTSKLMSYNATYHTNKVRMVFEHNVLVKHDVQISFEIFRS